MLTLDRPEARNAFDQALYRGLAVHLRSAAAADAVHVLVLTATGPAFSAGQDLNEMALLARGESLLGGAAGFTELLEALEAFDKPLIAAVNGAATGIGATLLLHCDLVVMADIARLRMPFAELGVPPEAASSVLLPQRIGWQRAAELFFTARWVGADEAVDLGLALRVVTVDELLPMTMALALEIAGKNPAAVRIAKRLMLAARGDVTGPARARENHGFVELGFGSR